MLPLPHLAFRSSHVHSDGARPATEQTGDDLILHFFNSLKVRQMGSCSPEDLRDVMLSTVTFCNPGTLLSSLPLCVSGCIFCSLKNLALCILSVVREPLKIFLDKLSLKGLWTALTQYSLACFYADTFPGNIWEFLRAVFDGVI